MLSNAIVFTSLALPGMVAGQGRLVTDSVSSPGIAANVVGDNPVRGVVTYLPPSYVDDSTRRYPVLYMLHGATSVPEEWLDAESYQGLRLQLTLDSLIAAGAIPEMIVVMPNANNALGAGWYTNSPALGHWEDFVVHDVVGHMDTHYRTDARRTRRALFGHSMGGFGALAIAFRHPDLFGFVYASSPALVALTGAIGPAGQAWPALAAVERWQDAPGDIRVVLGLAAALDGSATSPRLFNDLPFTQGLDGAWIARPDVRARWSAGMPPDLASAMVRRGDAQPVILLESGSREAGLRLGIRALRDRLDSLGIAYADSTFEGGHIDKVRDRLTNHLLPAVARWLGHSDARRGGATP
jgi:S-formylglutathione hydrolase FrmB